MITGGILTLTEENFSTDWDQNLVYMVYFWFGAFALKLALQWMIPDMPSAFKTVLKRHGVLVKKLMGDQPVNTKDDNERDPEPTVLGLFAGEKFERTYDDDHSSERLLKSIDRPGSSKVTPMPAGETLHPDNNGESSVLDEELVNDALENEI